MRPLAPGAAVPPLEEYVVIAPINLAEKLAGFDDYWNPRIVADLNDSHVKVVKVRGEFVWHRHADEDELFHEYSRI